MWHPLAPAHLVLCREGRPALHRLGASRRLLLVRGNVGQPVVVLGPRRGGLVQEARHLLCRLCHVDLEGERLCLVEDLSHPAIGRVGCVGVWRGEVFSDAESDLAFVSCDLEAGLLCQLHKLFLRETLDVGRCRCRKAALGFHGSRAHGGGLCQQGPRRGGYEGGDARGEQEEDTKHHRWLMRH